MHSSFLFSWFPASAKRSAGNDDFLPVRTRPGPSSRSASRWRVVAGSTFSPAAAVRWVDPDPFLLVLLAGQALEEKRTEQARSLIEAAYAAYDQDCTGS
jgi:hypothetical protein